MKRKGKDKTDSRNTDSGKNNISNETKQVTFEVEKLKSVRTDFCSDGSFQKCVQFGPDRSILATGGADGHLRVWKVQYPYLTFLSDIIMINFKNDSTDSKMSFVLHETSYHFCQAS